MKASVLQTFDCEFPCDCAVFSPWDGTRMALGTYYLKDADTQTKEGAVELYSVTDSGRSIARTARFTTGAVFDLKWLQRDVLVLARADGVVECHRADDVTAAPICASPDVCGPATYVDCADTRIITTHASGGLALWDAAALADGSEPLLHWPGHAYEAWVAAFDRSCPSCVWSGGDDGLLRLWDTRSSTTAAGRPAAQRRFDMGVTALACHAARPLLAVGSYDESLTLWDVRCAEAPVCAVRAEREATAGGGVWRLRWHTAHADVLLAACMHVGYRVFELADEAARLRLAGQYHGPHTSLAYGADWRPPVPGDSSDTLVAATCSFYDKKLSFWSVPWPLPQQQQAAE